MFDKINEQRNRIIPDNEPIELNFENYVNDDTNVFFYKIGLVGPTRVGKTSIIAALLDEARVALAQTGVSMKPFVAKDGFSPTRERIKSTISDIKRGLDASSFKSNKRGTADPFIFDLEMAIANGNKDKNEAQLRFAILDYPGDWLNDNHNKQEEWEKCKQWIYDSSVIIVPIDATIIMETRNTQRQELEESLQIFEVEELVRDWAKERFAKQKSGLLLFVPVKCETYFNDNGGKKDESQKLYDQFKKYYQEVIEAAREEMSGEQKKGSLEKILTGEPPTYSIEYHPVDTIGCIELVNAKWEQNTDGKPFFESTYMVRNPSNSAPQRKPFGNIGLLRSICKQIIENRQNSQIFRRFWQWLSGKNKLLKEAIEKLSKQDSSPRFKQIANGNMGKPKRS